ncbi:TKL/DRK protein kinase [Phytophthora nicotianae P10297]|uniref:TKL/DRK protein kinase n=3 Tax=Phytophthora nicotianae TaxID=4792 RepID=W2YSI0_PHYNI|nr:TKL/DRK protein kinase [Phytophthora nicotianae P10297]
MSGIHRFKSLYEDDSCTGAPTGVYARRQNDCENQVGSGGAACDAVYDSDDLLIGYVEDSCHDGRGAGFSALFDGEAYMAFDYYWEDDCTNYDNSAAYRAGGDCEAMIVDDKTARSATLSVSSSGLVWTRNMGPIATSLGCPGEGAPGYYEFDVPKSDINTGACKNFKDIGGAFSFYDISDPPIPTTSKATSTTLSPTATPATSPPTSSTPSWDATSNSQGNSSSTPSSGSTLPPTTSGSNLDGSSSGSLSSTPSPSTSTGRGLSVGAVSGIGGGAAVLVVVIILLAWCIVRRNKKTKEADSNSLQEPFLGRGSAWTGGTTDGSDMSSFGPGLWNDDKIIATRVPRDQVVFEGLICRGGYGEVYRGTYNHKPVAIKMLLPDMRGDLRKVNAFLAEAKLMASLAHPHIVQFAGVSWASLSDLCVLSELMKGGDLRSLLQQFEAQGHPQGIDDDKIRIAYHVAQALTYLHSLSPVVIHRDLKSKNVLLTENLDAKLTDFGISKEQQDNTMTAGVGTMLWMAPEVMMAERYTEKADIFSFGVLLSELDLHTLPYSHAMRDSVTGKKLPGAVIIQKVASGALQVEFSRYCLDSMVELGKECIALDPAARPSAPMIVFRLQTIMKGSFGEGYVI